MSREPVTLAPTCSCCLSGYHLPFFGGVADGTFASHGLDVTITEPTSGGIQNILDVAKGKTDCCLTSPRRFLEAMERYPDLEARFVFMVARRPHVAAFVIDGRPARHGEPIRSFADLAGASVLYYVDAPYMGVPEYFVVLRRLGIECGPRVEIDYTQLYESLAVGKADVAVTWLDFRPDFEGPAARAGVAVRALPFFAAGLDVYGSGVVAGAGVMRSRPEVLDRLTAALRESLVATRADPSAGLDALCARFPDRDRARALGVWRAEDPLIFGDGDPPERLGTMSAAVWERTIDHQEKSYGSPPVPANALFEPAFTS